VAVCVAYVATVRVCLQVRVDPTRAGENARAPFGGIRGVFVFVGVCYGPSDGEPANVSLIRGDALTIPLADNTEAHDAD
jgi:hypothetical protein